MNSIAEIGAVVKIGTLYRAAIAGLFEGTDGHADVFLGGRVPETLRAALVEKVSRVRLVPLCENVGALAHLPEFLEAFYLALERGRGLTGLPTAEVFRTRFDREEAVVRVFVAMSDTAEQSGKIATDAACTLALAGREEAERRLAALAREGRGAGATGHVPDRRRPRGLPRRVRPGAPGRHPPVLARRRRHDAGNPGRRARGGRAPRRRVPGRRRLSGSRSRRLRRRPRGAGEAPRGGGEGAHRDAPAGSPRSSPRSAGSSRRRA